MASFADNSGVIASNAVSGATSIEVENSANGSADFLCVREPETALLVTSGADRATVVSSTAPEVNSNWPLPLSSRRLDLIIGIALLAFVLPLMCVCAVAVRLSSPGPILFRQVRIGRNGREFTCLKFRTMMERAELVIDDVLKQDSWAREEWAAVQKLSADPRVTWLGGFMRRYCLDELPQLLNVLRGEMSIVGPRPIVADEIRRYGSHFADYCSVNPGLTGLWQVSGSHALSYDERVRLDVAYARSKNLQLDLIILLKTVPTVLFGSNV